MVYDRATNAALRTIEQGYFARSAQLDLAEWRRQQFVENTFRLVSAVL